MNSAVVCQKCGSSDVHQVHSGTAVEWFWNAIGYQPCRCKKCKFQWNQLLPLHSFFYLIYILLTAEVIFLLWQYLR
ncbi:MAG: hypothetical protein OEV35_01170 [Gallionellaceae bacterium]|nr:hypothetical protein [Gallionellaceae bacterium]